MDDSVLDKNFSKKIENACPNGVATRVSTAVEESP
jgi:hypothetical protein